MSTGCPYSEFSWKKNCEVCKLTKQPTGDKVECDFGYDTDCAEYIKKKARRKRVQPVTV